MLARARSASAAVLRRSVVSTKSGSTSSPSSLPAAAAAVACGKHHSRRWFADKMDLFSDEPWTEEEVRSAFKNHGLHAWGPTKAADSNIAISHGQGPYIYDFNGKRYFDLSSQAICANLGHTMPEEVRTAINDQISKVPFVFASLYQTEIRAKLSTLMAKISPGDLNAFVFLSTGSEANEAGIRIARHYTGKQKILSRRRAYHGASLGALAMTGDSRTHLINPMAPPGFVKIPDPMGGGGLTDFEWSSDAQCLAALEEQILSEGPSTIAAVWLEGITGTCGWMKPSTEWVAGVRSLCDKYGILLAFDEVMAGVGRTGKLFAFENYEGVQPDIVTGAKGISAAYLPVGYVGVSSAMQAYFMDNPMPFGGTYQAHPTCLAAAYSVMKYILQNDLIAKAKAMENVILDEMKKLSDSQPIVAYRCTGMAGSVEVAAMKGESGPQGRICSYNESHPMMEALKKSLQKNGVNGLTRGPIIHIAPPLITTEEQIREAFVDISKAFSEVF